MRQTTASLLVALSLGVPASAQDVKEPGSGVTFAPKSGDMSLLGVGLRTKTFLKVKVYAVGLYVADSALAGPLAAYRGKTTSPAFYKDLVSGDFEKQIQMKFVRDLSADQIRNGFREALPGADKTNLDTFVGYFGEIKGGQECSIKGRPGGALEVTVAGQSKPPIADKTFASAVFGIWLGEKPIQDDIKKSLVARADGLIK